MLTNGNNAVGCKLVDNQQAMMTWNELSQHLFEENMIGLDILMDGIWQCSEYIMNNPQQREPVISLNDRQPEVVNTTRLTLQAIDQVNRATALIDAYQNGKCDNNDTIKPWDRNEIRDQTREEFIAFSSLFARNFNNPNFAQFANNLEFYPLFNTYCSRYNEPKLMNFFIRVANCKDLTPKYLKEMKKYIKRFDVVIDVGYEQYLRKTYNTIKDMFTTNDFDT